MEYELRERMQLQISNYCRSLDILTRELDLEGNPREKILKVKDIENLFGAHNVVMKGVELARLHSCLYGDEIHITLMDRGLNLSRHLIEYILTHAVGKEELEKRLGLH